MYPMENDVNPPLAVERIVSRRWRVQAFDEKLREWYFIGDDSQSLQQAAWYRDHCLKPKQRRTRFRIVEESVAEKVVG